MVQFLEKKNVFEHKMCFDFVYHPYPKHFLFLEEISEILS